METATGRLIAEEHLPNLLTRTVHCLQSCCRADIKPSTCRSSLYRRTDCRCRALRLGPLRLASSFSLYFNILLTFALFSAAPCHPADAYAPKGQALVFPIGGTMHRAPTAATLTTFSSFFTCTPRSDSHNAGTMGGGMSGAVASFDFPKPPSISRTVHGNRARICTKDTWNGL